LHDDWFFKQGGRTRLINWLGIDSWIDSRLAETLQATQDRWNAASTFFARFRLTGWRRAANNLASESLSLGAGALLALYTLAIPAFLEFDENRIAQGNFSVKFLDRNGNEIGKRGILHNDAVPLEEIPDYLIKATLATEDRRFYDHFGVDVIGTTRALIANVQHNDVVQGGSTLTQQLAKNLFLSSERSLQRKIKEAFLALLLESRFTKREILKLYLDRAYMGGGAFGVEAAAQFYFGKSVRHVTLAEAAMLAGLFRAPTKYAPHVDLPAARARANVVLSNLVEANYMTAGQVHDARLNPAKAIENRQPYSPEWFLDWAFEEVQRIAEGRGQYVLTARTTIDVGLQQAAEEALVSTIRQYGRSHNARSGAVVSMDPDGAVRALVGGLDYGESQFNRATHAHRQPGSSFKLYVYATALENGFTSKTPVRDSPVSCGNWSPKNYDGTSGSGRTMLMQDAFKFSLNTVATELSLKVGRDKVVEMTERLGVQGVNKTCSMALGDASITPLEHTSAYATFANGGRLTKPFAILEISTNKGEPVYSREREEPPTPVVIKRRVVEQMNQMMQLVVNEGTGKRAQLDFTYAVGKTGTSSSYRDAWFLGFTGALVTGVWIGNDDYRPMLIQADARSGGASGVTGGSLPAMTWQSYMSVAHTSMNIPQIVGLPLHPTQIAELQRLAELKKTEPAVAAAATAPLQKKASIMPDQTRDALKRLAAAMRRAGGLPEPRPDTNITPKADTPDNKPRPATSPVERRADVGTTAGMPER
jgi:penicillin-binding protein 1A